MPQIERDSELAESESLDVLWSAFYAACEADLSEMGWPGSSRVLFENATRGMEDAMSYIKVKRGN